MMLPGRNPAAAADDATPDFVFVTKLESRTLFSAFGLKPGPCRRRGISLQDQDFPSAAADGCTAPLTQTRMQNKRYRHRTKRDVVQQRRPVLYVLQIGGGASKQLPSSATAFLGTHLDFDHVLTPSVDPVVDGRCLDLRRRGVLGMRRAIHVSVHKEERVEQPQYGSVCALKRGRGGYG